MSSTNARDKNGDLDHLSLELHTRTSSVVSQIHSNGTLHTLTLTSPNIGADEDVENQKLVDKERSEGLRFRAKNSSEDTAVGKVIAEASPEESAEEFSEYLALMPTEYTLVDFLIARSSKVRYLAYCCGLAAPTISLSSPWYFIFFFCVCWTTRICFVYSLFLNIFLSSTIQQAGNIDNVIITICTLFRIVAILPIVYLACYEKKRFIILKETLSSGRTETLMMESFNEVFYLLLVCILSCVIAAITWSNICENWESKDNYYNYLTPHDLKTRVVPLSEENCKSFSINYFVDPVGPLCVQSFVYFIFIFDLKYISFVFDTVISDIEEGRVNPKKYRAIKRLVTHRQNDHVYPMGNYIIMLFLGTISFALTLFGVEVLIREGTVKVPTDFLASYYFSNHFKDYFILLSIVWKISVINMKSRSLTLKIAAHHARPDNVNDSLYIFQQQVADPLLFLLLGLVPVYRNDLIISVATYAASIVFAFLNSRSSI